MCSSDLGFFESLEESLPVVSEPVRFVLSMATLEVISRSCRHSNHMWFGFPQCKQTWSFLRSSWSSWETPFRRSYLVFPAY